MKESISQIEARLREQGVEVAQEEIESRLRLLVETFAVPQNEATRSVVNYFLKEHGITPVSVFSKKSEEVRVKDISASNCWVDLKVKVIQLWDPTSDAISQTGLVGDDTGVIKFVKWTKAGLPDLAEGQSYLFKNVVTDVFQDRFSVKLNRTSEISELEEEIEVSPQIAQFSGAMVDIQKGSGLIKRCPVCRRALAKGVCGEHGRVEGTYDLRIKAVMDDGNQVQEALINRETTERLMGITLDEAKEMAMEALDHEIVMGLIEERLMGRYYKVTGPQIERYILVETVDPLPPVTDDEVAELMREAEGVI